MKNRYPIFAAMLGLAIGQLPSVAGAAVSWTFNTANCDSTSPSGNCGGGNNNFADTRTYNGGGGAGQVTVSGWANTINNNQTLERGQTTHYGGGLGVRNADYNRGNQDPGEGTSPEHGVDNSDRFDLVLFDFGTQSVDLGAVTLGYISNDSDISVLAYVGNQDPTDSGDSHHIGDLNATSSTEDLTSNGWQVIGNHDVDANPGGVPETQIVNTGDVASSYWIVAAYNPIFGGCSGCQWSSYLDYFKISGLSGDIITPDPGPGVPAPATLALMGLGLVGIGYRRRGKKTKG